jgi:CRP-like cAMP-binding protein
MFKNLFPTLAPLQADERLNAAERESEAELSSLSNAAELLTAPSALMQLSLDEAQVVVRYMHAQDFSEGTVFIREGDARDTDFMALVLSGDVVVESIVVSRISPITVTVLGPGSMHGELSLIDGLPRSASCTASSDLRCAILTRVGMLQLLKDDPQIGAKLMMAIAMRTGARLRDNTEKLKKYAQLTRAMQQEIDHLLPS